MLACMALLVGFRGMDASTSSSSSSTSSISATTAAAVPPTGTTNRRTSSMLPITTRTRSTSSSSSSSPPSPPNVMLFLMDDTRPEFIRGSGQRVIAPTMDKFMNTSTSFRRAYVEARGLLLLRLMLAIAC